MKMEEIKNNIAGEDIKIKLDNFGFGEIILNGKDVGSNVLGFELISKSGEMPILRLDLAAESFIEFEGKVKIKNDKD